MKRLLIILTIVLLLFVAVLVGARFRDDSDDRASDKHWYTSALDRAFGDREPLRSRDVTAPCFTAGAFRVRRGVVCAAVVRPADARVRAFRLNMVSGDKVAALLEPAGKYSVSIKVPLKSDNRQTPNLQAPKDGAKLTLTCEQPPPVAPAECLVLLAPPKSD